jgi:hypothetical protein
MQMPAGQDAVKGAIITTFPVRPEDGNLVAFAQVTGTGYQPRADFYGGMAAHLAKAKERPNLHVPVVGVPKNDRGNPSQICKTTMLARCKFTSKHTQEECKEKLCIVLHKRGHFAVACASKHQTMRS